MELPRDAVLVGRCSIQDCWFVRPLPKCEHLVDEYVVTIKIEIVLGKFLFCLVSRFRFDPGFSVRVTGSKRLRFA